MIAWNRSIILVNTFGYKNAFQQSDWDSVIGGIVRIDIREDESGCDTVWISPERSPSIVAKLSTATGLVYAYTFQPQENGENAWYFTALDPDTGETIFKILTGAGSQYDGNWGAIALGADGTAYLSTLKGMAAIWDEG
jgi:outer membrane protein assembly factor BamB